MNRTVSRVGLGILCMLAASIATRPSVGRAQTAAIGISRTGDLRFGQVISGVSGGAIVISPSGSRTATGGAMLGNGAAAAAASFTVSGEPLSAYAVTLSATADPTNGSQTMTIDDFISSPSGIGALDASGSQTLTVGATLRVTANQTSGTYNGSFVVRIDYN